MKCVICKSGSIEPGSVTVTLHRNKTLIVIRDVPGEICRQCGEYYLEKPASERVMIMAEEAIKRNTEVEILRYAA